MISDIRNTAALQAGIGAVVPSIEPCVCWPCSCTCPAPEDKKYNNFDDYLDDQDVVRIWG